MRRGVYRTLAWTGVRNNRKLYVPYLLTCAGMVMMCYIVSFLAGNPTIGEMRGGETIQSILVLGFGVLAVFSVIFPVLHPLVFDPPAQEGIRPVQHPGPSASGTWRSCCCWRRGPSPR